MFHLKNSDTYFIKTFNPEKNDYSAALFYNNKGDVIVKNKYSIKSSNNRWIINYDGNDGATDNSKSISIHPLNTNSNQNSKLTNKKLINYYDENGQNINELVDNIDSSPTTSSNDNIQNKEYNWKYETPTTDSLPIKKN